MKQIESGEYVIYTSIEGAKQLDDIFAEELKRLIENE